MTTRKAPRLDGIAFGKNLWNYGLLLGKNITKWC
jgi:hypothetical protein